MNDKTLHKGTYPNPAQEQLQRWVDNNQFDMDAHNDNVKDGMTRLAKINATIMLNTANVHIDHTDDSINDLNSYLSQLINSNSDFFSSCQKDIVSLMENARDQRDILISQFEDSKTKLEEAQDQRDSMGEQLDKANDSLILQIQNNQELSNNVSVLTTELEGYRNESNKSSKHTLYVAVATLIATILVPLVPTIISFLAPIIMRFLH